MVSTDSWPSRLLELELNTTIYYEKEFTTTGIVTTGIKTTTTGKTTSTTTTTGSVSTTGNIQSSTTGSTTESSIVVTGTIQTVEYKIVINSNAFDSEQFKKNLANYLGISIDWIQITSVVQITKREIHTEITFFIGPQSITLENQFNIQNEINNANNKIADAIENVSYCV